MSTAEMNLILALHFQEKGIGRAHFQRSWLMAIAMLAYVTPKVQAASQVNSADHRRVFFIPL